MEKEYVASSESCLEVTESIVTKLEGPDLSAQKMAKVKTFVTKKVTEEHNEEIATLLKKMETRSKRKPTDAHILDPAKAIREQGKKAAAAAKALAEAKQAEDLKNRQQQVFQEGPPRGAPRGGFRPRGGRPGNRRGGRTGPGNRGRGQQPLIRDPRLQMGERAPKV